jgi:hypothetical protein
MQGLGVVGELLGKWRFEGLQFEANLSKKVNNTQFQPTSRFRSVYV